MCSTQHNLWQCAVHSTIFGNMQCTAQSVTMCNTHITVCDNVQCIAQSVAMCSAQHSLWYCAVHSTVCGNVQCIAQSVAMCNAQLSLWQCAVRSTVYDNMHSDMIIQIYIYNKTVNLSRDEWSILIYPIYPTQMNEIGTCMDGWLIFQELKPHNKIWSYAISECTGRHIPSDDWLWKILDKCREMKTASNGSLCAIILWNYSSCWGNVAWHISLEFFRVA